MADAASGNARIARNYFAQAGEDLFPDRAPAPPDCPVHLAEFEIVESAYANRRRAGRAGARGGIVNFGPFGWRLWSSIPLLAMAYRRRGRADLAQELTDDPMGFARAHWLGRHPRLRWLAYSDGDMLGPGRVLRLWVPVLRPVQVQRQVPGLLVVPAGLLVVEHVLIHVLVVGHEETTNV